MKTFRLVRHIDVSGISGTGTVAEGIQFSDGVVVLRWLKAGTARPDFVKPTTVVHDDIDSVIGLHGHNGATVIEWDGGELRDRLEALASRWKATRYRIGQGSPTTVEDVAHSGGTMMALEGCAYDLLQVLDGKDA